MPSEASDESTSPRFDLSLEEAIALCAAAARPTGVERVPLIAAHGRVLAEDLASLRDRPEGDDSSLDGYALRRADVTRASESAPAVLELIGEAQAGRPFMGSVAAGQAVRIATGGLMPDGGDAVVGVEHADDDGVSVRVTAAAASDGVRPRGQDLRASEIYLRPGRRLDAASLALAAAMGHAQPLVARKPRILVVATGDELRPPGSALNRGQLYESNSHGLAALLTAGGADVHLLSQVADDAAELAGAVHAALDAGGADLIVSSGGVSRGPRDTVRDLLLGGGELVFWRVLVRPAGPTMLARYQGVPWLGLPGNPVSSLVGCLLFVFPILQTATGDRAPFPFYSRARAVVASRFAAGHKQMLQRARLVRDGATLRVLRFENQSSGVLRSLVESDALVVVPEGAVLDPERGDVAEVIELARFL